MTKFNAMKTDSDISNPKDLSVYLERISRTYSAMINDQTKIFSREEAIRSANELLFQHLNDVFKVTSNDPDSMFSAFQKLTERFYPFDENGELIKDPEVIDRYTNTGLSIYLSDISKSPINKVTLLLNALSLIKTTLVIVFFGLWIWSIPTFIESDFLKNIHQHVSCPANYLIIASACLIVICGLPIFLVILFNSINNTLKKVARKLLKIN